MKYQLLESKEKEKGSSRWLRMGVDFLSPVFRKTSLLDRHGSLIAVFKGTILPWNEVVILDDFLRDQLSCSKNANLKGEVDTLVRLSLQAQDENDTAWEGADDVDCRAHFMLQLDKEPALFHIRLVGLFLGAYSAEIAANGRYLRAGTKLRL